MTLLLVLACGEKEPVDTSTGTDDSAVVADDTGATDDTGADTGEVTEPDAPVIQSCDAFCYLHETGEQFYNWRVECSVTDPQGVDNVWNGEVIVAQGQTTAHSDLVACDATGFCSASFTQDNSAVQCAQASSYDFLVKVQDWDQNWSAPMKVQGRQQ